MGPISLKDRLASSRFVAIIASAVSIALSCAYPAIAQTQSTSKPLPSRHGSVDAAPIPLNHAYWHFFMYQIHLDQAAAEHEKRGKDGSELRDALAKQLGFSTIEFSYVHAAAIYVSQEIAKMDIKAQAIIAQDRAAMRANPLPPGTTPPGLTQLKFLTEDRENLLKTQIRLMNDGLGPAKAKILEDFLRKKTLDSVASIKVVPPAPGGQK